jgi:hypothetical protein
LAELYVGLEMEPVMTAHVLQYVEFSDQDRRVAKSLGDLGESDEVEVWVRRKSGEDHVVKRASTALENVVLACRNRQE